MADTELLQLRARAARKLDAQQTRARRYLDYYDGDCEIMALLDTEERRVFRSFLRESGANWCELVANAVAERLQVTGFRFEGADDAAWEIWQASHMDADAELVQTDAIVAGCSFVLVQPDDDNPTGVSISAESPLEATVLYEPGNRRRRVAGYKRFADEAGAVTEVLVTPDVIATWYPQSRVPEVDRNAARSVGLIQITPQPRTYGPPRSELTSALVIQDRINTTIFNRLVSADYGAFRQIWASGVKLRETVTKRADGTEDTRKVSPYNVGANRLLVNERPEARFGAFPEATLEGYLKSVEQDVNQLAAITQTPPHYLLGQMVNLSADAIKAAEAGLVAKVTRRALHTGEDWEIVMREALAITGNPAAADVAAEVVWRDFETRSEGQRVDALVKMATLDVPRVVLWERWGASMQEIKRWEQLAAQQAASDAATQAAAFGAPDAAYARLLAAGNTAPAGPPAPAP